MTDKVFEFKDQKIKEYLGDINYFLEQRNAVNMREFEQKTDVKPTERMVKESREKRTLSYEQQKRLKALNNRLSRTESKITQLEKAVAKADMELAENYEKLMNDAKWFGSYEKMKKDLDDVMMEWEEVQEALENENVSS